MQTVPQVSIIVPVKDEAGNMALLLGQLSDVLKTIPSEVIFVDDSGNDLTGKAIQEAIPDSNGLTVHYAHRKEKERTGGLAGAVATGFTTAQGQIIVVMDGDLQHPPATIKDLLRRIDYGFDIVVASRYCKAGSSQGLSSATRHAVSRSSTILAKLLFRHALRDVTDPMTGFFAFRRSVLKIGRLKPRGFKILLELFARHPEATRSEVPLEFAERHSGVTKSSLKQGIEFCVQLLQLRLSASRLG